MQNAHKYGAQKCILKAINIKKSIGNNTFYYEDIAVLITETKSNVAYTHAEFLYDTSTCKCQNNKSFWNNTHLNI